MRPLFFWIISTFFVSGALWGQDREALQTELDKLVYLDAQVNFERTPGFVVGVIWGDSTFFYAYGSVFQDSTLLPDSASVFEIAELGHIFLGELAFQLHEQGQLSLEQPPGCGPERSIEISTLDLLSHYSGLNRSLPDFGDQTQETSDPYQDVDETVLFEFLQETTLLPGTYNFSNLNYAILGNCLAAQQETSYPALVQQQIWSPLGMTQSGVAERDSILVPGYDKTEVKTAPWSRSAMEPAVGLRSSVADLTTFIHYLLRKKRFQELADLARPTDIRDNTEVSWGWHVLQIKKYYPIFVQSGATSGHRAYAAVVPETRTGVVILSNSPYGLNGLGFMILRMLNNYWKK